MSRALTTLVQLVLAGTCFILIRMMIQEWKANKLK
jgi:hypothetical protein